MAAPRTRTITPKQLVKAYARLGSLKKVWKSYPGSSWQYVLSVYRKAVAEQLMPAIRSGAKTKEQLVDPTLVLAAPTGSIKAIPTEEAKLPKRGVKRYLFTSAQNNTGLFSDFWTNLLALKDHYKTELHVSRFVYLTSSIASVLDKNVAFDALKTKQEKDDIWWAPELSDYLSDARLEVAPGLVWCGEMNILPTAERPLSGLEVYTGRKSAIIPHAKVAMQSVPSSKHAPTKFNYTTGTVTMRNYIQRKAGLKAEFHHTYAALLVEVDADGDWFCRQVVSDSDGVLHDLDVRVADGEVTTGNHAEAITWGDIHVAQMEPWVQDLSWGKGGMLDFLSPKYQFFHDVLDFRARSHHDLKHPHRQFRRYLMGETDVRAECTAACGFLEFAYRGWCDNIVVDSNHHDHLGRWLEEQDGRLDPKNVEFWTQMQSAVWADLRRGTDNPNYLRLMVQEVQPALQGVVTFLDRDTSYVICPDSNGGIECGEHGHHGPNGSRGSAQSFSRLGRKANVGHSHSACIYDGVHQAGTCGKLDPDWTTGASSWSHSDIVTYPNGKRTIITKWNGKWRAKR